MDPSTNRVKLDFTTISPTAISTTTLEFTPLARYCLESIKLLSEIIVSDGRDSADPNTSACSAYN